MVAFWHWKVTALEVGLIGALAGLAAAIVSPITTWAVARVGYRSERNTRIHHDRRDAYAAVLRDAYLGRATLDVLAEALDAGDVATAQVQIDVLNPDSPEAEAERLMQAALFSSDRVLNRHSEFVDTWNEAVTTLDGLPMTSPEERAEFASLVREEREKLQARLTPLRQAVRDDLTK